MIKSGIGVYVSPNRSLKLNLKKKDNTNISYKMIFYNKKKLLHVSILTLNTSWKCHYPTLLNIYNKYTII